MCEATSVCEQVREPERERRSDDEKQTAEVSQQQQHCCCYWCCYNSASLKSLPHFSHNRRQLCHGYLCLFLFILVLFTQIKKKKKEVQVSHQWHQSGKKKKMKQKQTQTRCWTVHEHQTTMGVFKNLTYYYNLFQSSFFRFHTYTSKWRRCIYVVLHHWPWLFLLINTNSESKLTFKKHLKKEN